MKKTILLTAIALVLFGCTINPSKEARIQLLEAQIEQAFDRIETLEKSIEILEITNAELELRVGAFKDGKSTVLAHE